MRVRKNTVAEVVKEASAKMGDANFSAVMVGGFVQEQHQTAQYISAHEKELGGPEAVVGAIFHAALIGLCYQRAHNRSVPSMSFADLDRVAGPELAERLRDLQPHIHEYIHSNIDDKAIRDVLYLVALAMDWAS